MAAKPDVRRGLAQVHLVISRIAPGNDTAGRAGYLNPVIHVVLLEHPAWTEAVLRNKAHGVLYFRRRGFINDRPAPDFHFIGSTWMPYAQRTGEPMDRKVGKDSARGRRHPSRARKT